MQKATRNGQAVRVAATILTLAFAGGEAEARRASSNGGLQCVPFARSESGVQISGDARTWWSQAAGIYARGREPEFGSVLHFPGVRGMPLGHVAVVSGIVSDREVLIDHANWAGPGGRKGQVIRNMRVVDVSDRGDWSRVRVYYDRTDRFGNVYLTSGFIHPRPPGSDPIGVRYAQARSEKALAIAKREQIARLAPELASLDGGAATSARAEPLPLPPAHVGQPARELIQTAAAMPADEPTVGASIALPLPPVHPGGDTAGASLANAASLPETVVLAAATLPLPPVPDPRDLAQAREPAPRELVRFAALEPMAAPVVPVRYDLPSGTVVASVQFGDLASAFLAAPDRSLR